MFKNLLAALLARLTPQTVESALAIFNAQIDRLQVIADNNLRKAAEHGMAIKEAQAAQALAQAEADRAAVVAGKIKTLVSGS